MTIAADIRGKVNAAHSGTIFATSDFNGPRPAVESTLSRLTTKGSLVRVRRGTYWKGVKSRFGTGRPSTEDIVLDIAHRRGIGPTGWLAGYRLGLSTQVPGTLEFAVIGAPPTGVEGAVFHHRSNMERHDLNYLEVGVLEVLRTWPDYSESSWNDLVSRIRELTLAKRIRPHRLFKATECEWSRRLRERAAKLRIDLGGTYPSHHHGKRSSG